MTWGRNAKNTQSVAWKWFASYLFVFLVPVVVFIALSQQYNKQLVSQIQYYNMLSARQQMVYYDGLMERVSNVADTIVTDEAFSSFLDGGNVSPLDTYNASRMLAQTTSKNKDIESVYVSCPEYGMLLGNSVFGTYRLMYDSYFADSSFSYEEFLSCVTKRGSGPQFYDFSLSSRQEKILLVRPLRLFPRNARYANLVLVLPRFSSGSPSPQKFAILDDVRQCAVYAAAPLPVEVPSLLENGRELFVMRSGNGNYMFASAHSSWLNWVYLVYADEATFLSNARIIRKLASVVLAVCIAIGLGIMLFLSGHSYRKVDDVIKRIDGTSFSGKGDELTYIGNSITRMQDEKRRQQDQLRSQVLSSLLEGNMPDRHLLENAGIVFPYDSWFVVITENPLSAEGLVTYGMEKCVLVNAQDERTLLECAGKGGGKVDCSSRMLSYRMVPQAWQQARDVAAYRKMYGLSDVASYDDLLRLVKGKNFSYPVDAEITLSDALKEGNEAKALACMDQVIAANTDLCISPQAFRFLLLNIAGTTIKVFSRMGEDQLSQYPEISLHPILQGGEMETTEKELKEMIRQICRIVGRKAVTMQQQQEISLYNAIVRYVQENHQDRNLSVTSVAEELGMTPVNLSRLFKKVDGSLISDYINGIRIQHAKDIMDSESNLADIAEQCGFGSLRTFMRVFKEREGMTPGQFKSLVTGRKEGQV